MYEKYSFTNAEKTLFDKYVHRIDIIAQFSPDTVNIVPGNEIKNIYVFEVKLQSEKYDIKFVKSIFNNIKQNIILLLTFENRSRFVVQKERILESEWMDSDSLYLPFEGLDLDSVWKNFIMYIGGIKDDSETTLVELIHKNDDLKKLQKQIDDLDKKIGAEKQPVKKGVLHSKELELIKRMKELESK